MSKVALERVTSSFGFQAAFNDTLAKIESEFTDKVLYRDNPVGTTNEMKNDLDMGTHDVLNVKMVDAQQFRVGGVDLDDAVNQLIDDLNTIPAETMGYRDEAIAARNAAQLAESGAQASENAAQASALTASTKASEASTSASQAAVSASNALAEKQLAALFAGNASQSATDALGHANDAAASAAQALVSQNASAASALASDASADAAAISEANAASSASAAHLSEVGAAISEDAALQYKNDIIDLFADYTINGLHTHSNKAILDGTQESFTTALKTKLDGVATNANNYVLPVASAALGGVKSGTDITVDASGNVSVNDNSHAHTIANVTSLQTSLDAKAPLASPALTGTPTAPTAALGTNTTQVATTAFVNSEIANDAILKTGGTMSGDLTFSDDNEGIALNSGARVYKKSGYGIALKRHTADTDPVVENNAGTTVYKLWHEGNDGAGSTLDADLLDGQQGSYYLDWTNVTNKPDPVITLAGDATGSVTLTDVGSGTLTVAVVDDSHDHIIANVDGLQTALDGKAASVHAHAITDITSLQTTLNNKTNLNDARLPILVNVSLPTTVGNYIEIGKLDLLNGAHNIRLSVTVSGSGFSVAKLYDIVTQFGSIGMCDVKPVFSTGAYAGNDFELEISMASTIAYLRLRRTAGTIGATANVNLMNVGNTADVFTPTSGSGVSAATGVYSPSRVAVTNLAPLTASRAIATDANGALTPATTTATELGYVAGVTSAIQTQLNGKSSTSHTHTDATTSVAGFMSSTDKTKLDGIQAGAQVNANITKAEIEAKLTGEISTHSHAGGGIAEDSITNVLLANMAVSTIKGRATAGTGDPEDLTATQVRTILNVADGAQKNSDITKAEIEAKLIGLISSHEHTNCDTVDGYHAQKTAALDKIPVAGAGGKLDLAWLPAQASSAAGVIPVTDGTGKLDAGFVPDSVKPLTLVPGSTAYMLGGTASGTTTSYPSSSPGFGSLESVCAAVTDQVCMRMDHSGTVTVSFRGRANGVGSGTEKFRIIKNGTLVKEWTGVTASGGTTSDGVVMTANVAVVPGDIICIQGAKTGGTLGWGISEFKILIGNW